MKVADEKFLKPATKLTLYDKIFVHVNILIVVAIVTGLIPFQDTPAISHAYLL